MTSGSVKEFVLRPSEVLICNRSNIEEVKIVNIFISVNRKQAVRNRAKVVIQGESGKILTEG